MKHTNYFVDKLEIFFYLQADRAIQLSLKLIFRYNF